MNDQASNTVTI